MDDKKSSYLYLCVFLNLLNIQTKTLHPHLYNNISKKILQPYKYTSFLQIVAKLIEQ